jgi:CDP-diglyceride synthetase
LGEVGIWIAVILIGLVALGVREYARISGTFAARLEKIRITLLATTLILLFITATVLATGFIVAIVLVEIWQPLLVAMAVAGGLLASIVWLRSPSK